MHRKRDPAKMQRVPTKAIISSTPKPSFEGQARFLLRRYQSAMRDVIGPLLAAHPIRAADLVEALGVDTRLAWKFVKILDATDPLSVVKYLPGERGARLFMRAAERRNAPAAPIAEARAAFAALEEFVQEEAGDRQSFEMMVTGHAPDQSLDMGLEHRRGAFEYNGYIWGVQARMQIHTYLIQPSGDDEHLDVAVIRGFLDLRRIRPQTPWRISRFYSIDDAGRVRTEFSREPLDPACSDDDVPLLRAFCSQPLPSVRRVVGPQGIIDHVLAESDVGNAQSMTCLTGELIRRAEPCYADDANSGLGTLAPLRTPCELITMDVFVRADLLGVGQPALRLFSDMFNETLGAHYTDADRLPCACRVERVADGPDVPPLREMPKYAGMIQACFDHLAWDAAAFKCYRACLRYPPIPAALIIDFPLPRRG